MPVQGLPWLHVVFGGRRSLHFHFIFFNHASGTCSLQGPGRATKPARNTTPISTAAQRPTTSIGIRSGAINSILRPSIPSDDKMRSLTQWRRTPWAVRTLEKSNPAFDLPIGTPVRQSVLHENLRTQAPRLSVEYLVPSTFRSAIRCRQLLQRRREAPPTPNRPTPASCWK